MAASKHPVLRTVWWSADLLLKLALVTLLYSGTWEFSVRQYLRGFSNAVVPAVATPEQKVESILDWLRAGPARAQSPSPQGLAQRDPETTLNDQELLRVCGTATNAFVNLARSSGLAARRLLLLSPDGRAKHVVAEVKMEGRWVIVDPSYRAILRDAQGRMLTRQDLQDPQTFREATRVIPGYPPEYSYEKFAHIRLARLPLAGLRLRRFLNAVYPRWDEKVDLTLLVERESMALLAASIALVVSLLLLRILLVRYADRRWSFTLCRRYLRLFGSSPNPYIQSALN
ncbi:MAG: transglutaminase domain-containing protein [Acidobacteriia bacterium]|nr:transglutaminase domain-containing protein [Terriglobia bacterium]